MASNTPLQPQGNTYAVTTNGTTLTPSAAVILFTPGQIPSQVRVYHSGATNPVFISFTTALRTAAIAVPGTPQLEVPLLPGAERVFTLPQFPNSTSVGNTATQYALQINTISVGTSINLYLTFGEGQ